jgi:hypothetical protein
LEQFRLRPWFEDFRETGFVWVAPESGRLRSALADFQDTPEGRLALRELLEARTERAPIEGEGREEVLRQELERGRWSLGIRPVDAATDHPTGLHIGASQPVDLADLAQTPAKEPEDRPPTEIRPTWIEIVVVDAKGEPVKDRKYELELSDRSVRKGILGADGIIRLDDITAGFARLKFPTETDTEWCPTPAA